MKKSVTVIGGGYVGFPNAIMIASKGFKTTICDINHEVVDKINNGKYLFHEEKIDASYKASLKNKFLNASKNIMHSDIYIIAVPTPIDHENKAADLLSVLSAIEAICSVARVGDLVILMSTCPIGTTEKLYEILQSNRPDLQLPPLNDINYHENLPIDFVFSPERILPGNTLAELTQNSRVVGGLNKSSTNSAYLFLNQIYPGQVVKTYSAKYAEMSKIIENSSRDLQLAFVNQLEMNCEVLGLDVHEVIKIANMHPRVDLLNPGIGVGGHCIPIDPYFLIYEEKTNFSLLEEARVVNDAKEDYTVQKILGQAEKKGCNQIVLFGLTYKPDVDDFRESPALRIFKSLQKQFSGSVFATDIFIDKLGKSESLIDQQTAVSKDGLVVKLVAHTAYGELSIPMVEL